MENNKIYLTLVVFLSLIILGLVSYIVLNKKFIANPNLEGSQESNQEKDSLYVELPTETGLFSPGYIDKNVTNFYLDDLLKNDNLDLNQNFQNVKLNK